MKTRRSDCPISCSLDVIGDKWVLLIIRDMLVAGKKNFMDFLDSDEGISTNILTERLDRLVVHGIIRKQTDKQNRLKINYTLTPRGMELAPILISVMKWGEKHFPNTRRIPGAEEL